jgi:dTDP-4-dehydrorhamnose reductase
VSKYLLTGGSGVLGTELQKHLDCFAPTRQMLDITDINTFRGLTQYKYVIHCAAYTDVPGAEVNRQKATEANVIGSKNVIRYFNHSRVFYISTDYVYAGLTGNYKETDITAPFNFYGFTKLAGESYFNPNIDLVIRTSFKPATSWKYPAAFDDLYTSADYVDVIAPLIARVIESDATGVINVGTERKSVYDLASRRNAVEKTSANSVQCVKMPKDVSMNLDRLKKVQQ